MLRNDKRLQEQSVAALSNQAQPPDRPIEPFLTIGQAAEALSLKYYLLQRGIRRGTFSAYRVGGRPRVRLSEIIAVIQASKIGGQK
jgi:excisionase family DNA binding protein